MSQEREQALQMLRGGQQGIDEWNHFRATVAIPHLSRTDLSRVDLSNRRLTGVDLSYADLRGANFAHSDLSSANLSSSNLTSASLLESTLYNTDLSHTLLADAELFGAIVHAAKLDGADLQDANLETALLTHTTLRDTDFAGTMLGLTLFAMLDLSGTHHLEKARHASHSTICIDTIRNSRGKLPDRFLRGCGYDPLLQRVILGDYDALADAAYNAAQSLRLQSCFISYSSKDSAFVNRLQEALNERGVDYWYAPEHGVWGNRLTTQIDKQIALRDRVLLVCSRNSLADSRWVRWEIDKALAEEERRGVDVIFPIMIDDTILTWDHPTATRIRETLVADFRNATKGKAFEDKIARLLDSLRAASGKRH